MITSDEYKSNPVLQELAVQLAYRNRLLQQDEHTPAEIRQFLRGYAAAFIETANTRIDPDDLPTGVTRSRNGQKFIAQILDPQTKMSCHLGTFPTPDDASNAYQAKHVEFHGERSPYFHMRKATHAH